MFAITANEQPIRGDAVSSDVWPTHEVADGDQLAWSEDFLNSLPKPVETRTDDPEAQLEEDSLKPAKTDFPFVEAYNDDNQDSEGIKAKIWLSLDIVDSLMPIYIEKPELQLWATQDWPWDDGRKFTEAQVQELIKQQTDAITAVLEEAGFKDVPVTLIWEEYKDTPEAELPESEDW